MTETRVRWRITLDELCYRCGVDARTMLAWASVGVLGARYREAQNQGWARHITRLAAQRAIIASRLIRAGLTVERAAELVGSHQVNEGSPLIVSDGTTSISIDRRDLP